MGGGSGVGGPGGVGEVVREEAGMFSTIEVAAKGLLNDPSWNWVFKNTFDAIEDKLNKVCLLVICLDDVYNIPGQTLFVTATLGILVRFISNLTSGDLLCIVNDLTANSTGLQIRHFLRHPTPHSPSSPIHKPSMPPSPSSISGPFHISLSAYAAQEPGCKDKVDTHDAAGMIHGRLPGLQQPQPPSPLWGGQVRGCLDADAGETGEGFPPRRLLCSPWKRPPCSSLE